MSKSTVSAKRRKDDSRKPQKPYPDFPLFPHATGLWAKKIKGKTYYFGKWDDSQTALDLYNIQRDDLYAGRTPRSVGDGLTLGGLCNRFLNAKLRLRDSGEITTRTFVEYKNTTDGIVGFFGKNRLVDDLAADDFEHLRAELAKKRGPVSLGNEIGRARVLFKYGYDAALIEKPLRYGSSFNKPSKKTLRRARAANGSRMFEAAEIRKMLKLARVDIRAMVMLGINAGLGNGDISGLRFSHVDLDTGWMDYPRPVARRCKLWPETVDAIRESIAKRRKPIDPANAERVFITRKGNPWCRDADIHIDDDGKIGKINRPADKLAPQFTRLRDEAEIAGGGRGFYSLRHTFETIAGGSLDQPSVDHIMGHARDDMASLYRERIDDERLKKVSQHVRKWLFAKAKK